MKERQFKGVRYIIPHRVFIIAEKFELTSVFLTFFEDLTY